MNTRSIVPLLIVACGALDLPSAAQQTAPEPLRVRHVGTATLDLETGELVRGDHDTEKSIVETPCFVNTDSSGFYSIAGAENQGDSWLDWGVFSTEGLVTSFVFGYATSSLDTTAGGPGADVGLAFYEGAVGYCQDGGLQPIAAIQFSGLPGATTGMPPGYGAGWQITVDITGGFEFEKHTGPFGFAIRGGGSNGSGEAQTGPLLCYSGSGSGTPDANGQENAFDVWVPDLRGFCSATYFYRGAPMNITSWYLQLNTADESMSTQAASVNQPGLPPNPNDYVLFTDAVLGEVFSGFVSDSKGHPLYSVLMYPGGTLNVPAGACRTILCDITQPQIQVIGPLTNGTTFAVPVGNNTDHCGEVVSSQAVCFGGGIPWSLTNAWECTVGF